MPGIKIQTFFEMITRITLTVVKKVGYLLNIWLTGKHWYVPLPPTSCHTGQGKKISENVRVYVVHDHGNVERYICR